MILKNVEEESILFLFNSNSRREHNLDSYSSLIMKYNYRDIYDSINFKLEDGMAYLVNDNLNNKKIIIGTHGGLVPFCFDLFNQVKSHKIESILIPVLKADYFEDAREDIEYSHKLAEGVKKILTVLAKHDKLSLEVKILEVERENEVE